MRDWPQCDFSILERFDSCENSTKFFLEIDFGEDRVSGRLQGRAMASLDGLAERSDDACAPTQLPPRHELAWILMDFLGRRDAVNETWRMKDGALG